MYKVIKTMEISASHSLELSYESKCRKLHGHNWQITVYAKAAELNADGMVLDFTLLKKEIHDALDHTHLNDVLPFNPTAENIARWCADRFPQIYRVDVRESAGNIAIYEKDE